LAIRHKLGAGAKWCFWVVADLWGGELASLLFDEKNRFCRRVNWGVVEVFLVAWKCDRLPKAQYRARFGMRYEYLWDFIF
jgi:hypothetical protein